MIAGLEGFAFDAPQHVDQIALRWLHVSAGVIWLGLLFFVNLVQAAFMPELEAPIRRQVMPRLLPRVLFWFRWAALFAWLSGVYLLMKLYYAGPYLDTRGVKPTFGDWGLAFFATFGAFAAYDAGFKLLCRTRIGHAIGVVISLAAVVAYAWWLERFEGFSGRAVLIHVGALLGTVMAANVWMRISPAQMRVVAAWRGGEASNPVDAGMAALRSRHNAYMALPLLLMMVGVHVDDLLAAQPIVGSIAAALVIGAAATHGLLKLASSIDVD